MSAYPAEVTKAISDLASGAANGYVRVVVKEGNGEKPAKGQTCEMHYTGTLTDGTKFDSSRDKNRTFKFRLGAGQVIGGWDKGVAEMSQGERAYLVCASSHAYGDRGYPGVIPPNATLVFDVELIGFN